MSQKKAGRDPARSLNLLWGSQTVPGRSGLTVKKIVATGMEIAGAEGIEELSMRKVADRIGVGTMSLYTYVPGKAELLDLMLDAAYEDLYDAAAISSILNNNWRQALHFIAKTNWDLFRKHPWILDLTGGRPVLGPHTTMKYDTELRALEGIGLTDIDMDASLCLVLMHVESCARLAVNIKDTQQKTGMDENEWWLSHAPTLQRLIDPARFPVASRVGEAAGQAHLGAQNPDYAYMFGLERIMDGIGMLIEAGKAK
ncbi:TetR/AcrR family transcriptional regulator [Paenibacillus alkalitolerans]|uniref:TetR/AcrR family transcriptional regulator n=1 Tax=Paenibacillus alkalitolerans TaxID=2799335 RepID=UPI0018F7A102|nr:TetR/AcrR family transcriptional regulator [Paenibacillus alkalitolerans]